MKYILSICTLLISYYSIAQTRMYYPDNSVKVFSGTRELTLAWCGGLNNPQFTMGDLNNDGKQDLVVYEPGKGVKTFTNSGVAGSPIYTYAPEYALKFPPVYNYLVLADYNCDNIPDLFHEGGTGFSVYRGYYNSANMLCFAFYKDIYYTNVASSGAVNAFNNPQDIPAILDVDNDGDLDFISYDINGGYMNLYKNMRVEEGLPCDTIKAALKDKCWGKVYQGFYRGHYLGMSCNNSGLKQPVDTAGKQTHSGNTPCLFDWDMDGDYDYLDGSVSFNEMTFLKNGKLETGYPVDTMISQDTMWQTGGKRISLSTWPAAFNVDIDQDGKKDLLIAPNGGNTSENYKCVWFYKNMSTAGVPDWQFKSDTFLIDKMIEAGTAAYPMLFDYNKDGKPDLFVGSEGYMQSTGLMRSRISYYRNTSIAGSPSFTLESLDFLKIDTFNFQGAAPAFGDIDNDGKADMILGHTNGTLTYYKNMAATDTIQPNWQPMVTTLTDDTGGVINVGGRATPFIYDIDKDGKKDLVIGNLYGTVQYYQNITTTPGTIKLKLINTKLGHIKADPNQLFGCFSTPFIGRIDSSGRDYLLLGSNSGNIYRFDSIASGDTTLTYPLLESQYSFIDSTYLLYNHPSSPLGVYGNLRSSVTAGDVDGDGDYEMITGTIYGGLNFYKRKVQDHTEVVNVPENGIIHVFPNPVSGYVNINWSGIMQPSVQVSVINMAGQIVYTDNLPTNAQHASVNVAAFPAGIYVCVVNSGARSYYSKMTVIH
ncbi:hypothetical protein CJD36_004615 [Flavipsychrobacter stenotrophus]|uniref:Secretion system C-terminal sorting domain-containing protein n=1 Tax=Flavipsychrobacter stenotrophus TaxID=2077091 RepID=A0A2S7T1D8_9BACT|nr:T9SS type A sorting domain-containing protein [Flavipsychrobacter stenotrophus]PQJ13032.1 hypothetical protein CJD36_004615 [Flavipsychrobacter stenotrophus]